MVVARASIKDGIVLDLCTGHGQYAKALSKHVRHVTAVDGSKDMLAHSKPEQNITFVLADVNGPQIREQLLDRQYTHVTVARGLHWVSDDALQHYTTRVLRPDGAIITASSGYSAENPWALALYDLKLRLKREAQLKYDWRGINRLPKFGFALVELIELRVRASVHWRQAVGAILFRGGVPSHAKQNSASFQSYMAEVDACGRAIMEPYMKDSRVDAEIAMTAYVFRRTNAYV
jgi:ubiquinone/menaquinone biosynthesis C-methylase UbiE